jgi:hypothetical protein
MTDQIPKSAEILHSEHSYGETTGRLKKPPTRGVTSRERYERAIYYGPDRAMAALRRGILSTFRYRHT